MNKITDLSIGFVLQSLGIALVIQAGSNGLGVFPITTCNTGIANTLGISYGVASLLVELMTILINYKFKEKIGITTILNAIFNGFLVDFWLLIVPSTTNIPLSILELFIGSVIMAFGFYFITKVGLGNMSSTGLMNVLMKLTHKSVSVIRTCEEITFMIVGILLGGSFGVFTIILSIGYGSLLGFIYKILKFRPENVDHHYLQFNFKKIKYFVTNLL